MRDLDALSRRCKIYLLKRFAKFTIVPLALFIAIGGGLWKVYNSSSKSGEVVLPKSLVKQKEVKPVKRNNLSPKKESIVSGVKVIQFVANSKKYQNTLLDEKKRFEQMGFSCYIKDGNDGFIRLRCLIPKNFRQISKVLKSKGIDFFLPTESKEFLEQLNLKDSNIVNIPIPNVPTNSIKTDKVVERTSSLIASKKATIDELINQYTNRPGFSRAIMIAKAYYDKKDYKNAAKWAKKANSINRKREEGWILYAKAVNALGQKERAVKILKVYLNFKSSKKVEKLLMQLKKADK